MALIENLTFPEGVKPLDLFKTCEALSHAEIHDTRRALKAALWQHPADMDRAKVLISKLFGLQIATGERLAPNLKPPIAAMRAQGRAAGDVITLLTT